MNKIALFLTAAILATVFSMPMFANDDYSYEAETEDFAITPDGNLEMIDDLDSDGRQFITVKTRSGAEFYIIIERNRDSENVYFLNQVDDKDLSAILSENSETPITESEPIEPEVPAAASPNIAPLLILGLAAVGGVAVYFIKFRKPKSEPEKKIDPDDFDEPDDDVEDEIEDEAEIETEDEE